MTPPADTWCKDGTPSGVPTTFPAHGTYSATWTCEGLNGGDSVTTCKTGHIAPEPTVVLEINGSGGPISVNRDNGDKLNISWNVDKNSNSTSLTTTCNKSGSSWGNEKLIPTRSLNDEDKNVNIPYPPYPINNSPYSLTCYNAGADTTLNSQEASDEVLVSVRCNVKDTWDCSAVDKVCGDDEFVNISTTQADCRSVSTDRKHLCEYPNCPVGSDWKEVRP